MSSTSPVESRGQPRKKIIVRRRQPEALDIDFLHNSALLAAQNSVDVSMSKDPPVRPKVVVSEKGLNFIQDQKEFVETMATPEDASATIPKIPSVTKDISLGIILSSKGPYQTQRTVQSLQAISELLPAANPVHKTCVAPVQDPTEGVLPSRRGLFAHSSSLDRELAPELEEESPQLQYSRKLQRFRSGGTFSYLCEDRVKASDKMKARIISLFQSKKSTNDENKPTSPLGHLKLQVKKTLEIEKRSSSPSAYITKKVSGIFKVVSREERVNAIKQKLQQVLSGESQADNQSLDCQTVSALRESQNCMKEQIEIQKIQKLQVRRNISIQNRMKADTERTQESLVRFSMHHEEITSAETDPSNDLNAEFIQIMEGVKQRIRPKVSPLSLDTDLPQSPLSPISAYRGKSKGRQASPQLLSSRVAQLSPMLPERQPLQRSDLVCEKPHKSRIGRTQTGSPCDSPLA